MFKKIVFFFISIVSLSPLHCAFADIAINEIMYDPLGTDTNIEWIEVKNTGDSQVDLSAWFIADYDTSWHFHAITASAGSTLASGAYALVVHTSQSNFADFKAKMPEFNGLLFRASFTLGNDAGRLGMSSDRINVLNDTSYASSVSTSNTGNSLQLINDSWVGAAPTPGAANETASIALTAPSGAGGLASSSLTSSNLNNNSSSQTSNTTETKSKVIEEPKIKTQITAKAMTFAGAPVALSAVAFGYNKEQLHSGKYFWNFGDGDSKEVLASTAEKFTHTYIYPGDYNINLEYYANAYEDIPDASDKIIIKVVPADIIISKVGDSQDFFVELSNNTNYDADISNWILSGNAKSFTFPKNTFINSKKSITVSSGLTNFTVYDQNALKLSTPQAKIVFDYTASVVALKSVPIEPEKNVTVNKISAKMPISQIESPIKKVSVEVETLPVIPFPNLGASVSSSDAVMENSFSYPPIILAIVLTLACAIAVYFIRQKKTLSNIGDDFKILDE